MDPEDYWEFLETYRDACCKVLREFHGYPAQFYGDGTLAYFGYPRAHEDDARQAIESGLRIVKVVGGLKVSGSSIRVRIGIHSGEVLIGQLGVGSYQARLALGEVPNLADRVQAEAHPNTVLITEHTRRLAAGFFELEEQQPQKYDQLFQRTPLYRVLASKGGISKLEAAEMLGLTPFVGRKAKIELLTTRWKQAQTGTRQIVELCGEAGIGKSRLVKILKEVVAKPDYVLECRCSPNFQSSALYPFIDLLERQLGFSREDSAEKKFQELEKWLISLKMPVTFAAPLLSELLGIPQSCYPINEPRAEARRAMMLNVLADGITAQAVQRPLLLVVEDLHWADPTTLELIEKIVRSEDKAAILECLTYRTDEFEPSWGQLSRRTVLGLERLPPEESKVLVTRVAGNKTLPGEVLDKVIERAEGVPLFVEEVTKIVLESDFMHELEDRYELVGPLPTKLTPDTVSELLASRIDRLDDDKHIELAHRASTLGREFSYELLNAISSQSEDDVRSGLAKLEEAELVFRAGRPPRAVYTFKHALIRDAAYYAIAPKERRSYHKRIAATLQSLFPDVAETQPELLATHFNGARMIVEAIDAWQRAGGRALERAANLEAISHLTQALDLLKTLAYDPERDKRELAMQLGLGKAYSINKGWGSKEVTNACRRAIPLAEKLGDGQSLYAAKWFLCFNYFLRGQMNESLKTGEEVLGMASATDNPILQVGAHHAIGYSYHYRGEFTKAREHAERGISLFDFEQERAIINLFQLSSTVALHEFCGGSLWMLGYPEKGLTHIGQAVDLARELEHPPSIAFALGIGCFAYHAARDFEWVENASTEVLELAEKEVFQLWDTLALMYHGWAIAMAGRIEQGIEEIEKGLEMFRLTGTRICLPTLMTMRGEVLWKGSRIQEALVALDEGIREATHPDRNEHFMEPELYRLKAEILKQRAEAEPRREKAAKDFEDAEDNFQKTLKLSRDQKARMLEIRAAVGLGRLWQGQGKQQEALQVLEKLYNSFTEGFDTEDLREAHILIEELSNSA